LKKRVTRHYGDYARTISEEGGKFYRGQHQDMGAIEKHVTKIRHMHEHATKTSNPTGWRHVGSVSPAVLMDWLNKNGFTLQQWAVNAGGDPYNKFKGGPGIYDKFLTYYLSRDFCKLHNDHVTTKRESSQIVVPTSYIGSKREDKRNAGNSGKELAQP
jgi:hypothetical protein